MSTTSPPRRAGTPGAASDAGSTTGALDGIRVLELGQVIAGPFCGQMLADLGADVVKVEPPAVGDVLRQWGWSPEEGDSLWWRVAGRNKRSITVDLRTPKGQDLVRRLARDVDVVVENFRPGTLERWGLGYDALGADNPGLILVRISGFGQDGPYAQRAGYAAIGEAMGGLRALTGYADRPPTRVGVSLGDSLTGLMGALGALAALHARERTGTGQIVDASIYESILAITEALIPEWQVAGYSANGRDLPCPASRRATSTRPVTGRCCSRPTRTLCSAGSRPRWAARGWQATRGSSTTRRAAPTWPSSTR